MRVRVGRIANAHARRARLKGLSILALVTVVGGILGTAASTSPAAAAGPCGPPVTSVIACENSLPGTPGWKISGAGDPTIQGFATTMSLNPGGTVHFKIKTDASAYHLDIYRMGYYGGDGARRVATGITPSATLPQTQPVCLNDVASGLIDCGNWAESASWAVPTSAVSGIYFALLTRNDTGGRSHVFFVVKNDASHSAILYQTSDATWQAYNNYGGNSLYTGTAPAGRAYKVSYNRPFNTASSDTPPGVTPLWSWVMYAEYSMVSWMERNGYDVSYTTSEDVDADTGGTLIRNHRIFMDAGHDEYWSGSARANVEAARDAGVNVAFFSGNDMLWKTRWENSIDGSSTPRRTLVTYKETLAGVPVDPQDPPTWTGTWHDPRFSPPADGGRPENALLGQMALNSDALQVDMTVPARFSSLRFWRNTSIATLLPGQVATVPTVIGNEIDVDVDNGYRPAGLIDMSATDLGSLSAAGRLRDGLRACPGHAQHHDVPRGERRIGLRCGNGPLVLGSRPRRRRLDARPRPAAGHGELVCRHGCAAGIPAKWTRRGVADDGYRGPDVDDHVTRCGLELRERLYDHGIGDGV